MQARLVALVAVLVVAALAAPDTSDARRIFVKSDTGFRIAAKKLQRTGGTIVLLRGSYGTLTVGPRPARRWLTVQARPGVSVARLFLNRSHRVRIAGVRIRPVGRRHGLLSITRSRQVTVARGVVSAAGTRKTSRVRLRSATRVLFRGVRFTQCGDGATCILTGESRYVQILGSRFHDCFGCDFVRGRMRVGLTIRGSSFDRAVPGRCGPHSHCNHQDAIQVQAGSRIVIEGNRFGLVHQGAGQIYASGPIDGLTIRNNVFLGTDPAFPNLAGWVGINLWRAGSRDLRVPVRVLVANNTILTGSPRPSGALNSIMVSDAYLGVPVELRPVFANNVFGVITSPEICERLQASSRNVTREGVSCSEADAVADPGVDWRGRPADGAIVIDQADPAWATRTDLSGRARDELPDIGAFEYVR